MDLVGYVKRLNVSSGEINKLPLLKQVLLCSPPVHGKSSHLILVQTTMGKTSRRLFSICQHLDVAILTVESSSFLSGELPEISVGHFVHLRDLTVSLLDPSTDKSEIYRKLRSWTSSHLFVEVQRDIVADGVIGELEYLSDANIIMADDGFCHVTSNVRGEGGKPRRETNLIVDNEIFTVDKVDDAVVASSPARPVPQASFNLQITKEQVAVKSSVDLPYLRAQKTQQPQMRSSGLPILADDHDDEDPDEDLDI
jgi:hypothetical protein